ncbi:hypothetical protein PSTG_03310 [Puccinia striiformis f. sp. tritici PST-78]|uniref:Translation initiation factor eIF4e n=1 Tax=Puccinia striiformis f. sp. tritici PST-78 TaxID=1165861 RepID=A0A0L0VWF9_9BASI|nr:hypothetical protein PSTG_03289 [Puccinia striiformis f. sp. tritici PST-78]KNF03367.1 hypothetical protein PSTG_03310 [Puccinia striiformis f. sp. tritici PST-78]
MEAGTTTTTGRLRLPISSLRSLDRRTSLTNNSPTTTTTTTTSTTETGETEGGGATTEEPNSEELGLLERRGSASDINLGINRARAPSLAAIQERIAARTNSNNNNNNNNTMTTELVLSTIQPKPEDQHQPTVTEIHPLQHSWTLYFDTRLTTKRSSTSGGGGTTGGQAYEAGLQPIGTFKSVEQFCGFFNWTVLPSQMEMNSSVQIFKSHIKPMWEDPANSKGGKWTITIKSSSNLALLDKLWTYLVLGLVGEQVENAHHSKGEEEDHFVCGAIVATRPRGNRIQIWVKEKDNVDKINGLGKRLINLLEINEHSGVSVDFSGHTGGTHGSSRFISIQPVAGSGGAGGGTPQGSRTHNGAGIGMMRPIIDGMMIGGMGSEKGMGTGGGGGVGSLMRRATSAQVSQSGLGSNPRSNPTSSIGGPIPNSFGGGILAGSGFRSSTIPNPTNNLNNGRTSQLSSNDTPIQNGVWRPSPTGGSSSTTLNRPPGINPNPIAQTGMMANFINANRRPQSAMTLPTLGSFNSINNNNPVHLNPGLGARSRQPSPAPSAGHPTANHSDTGGTSNGSRNPSPAPHNPIGMGILSGS